MKKFEVVIIRFYWDRDSLRFHRWVKAETEAEVRVIAKQDLIPQIAKDNHDSGWEDFYQVDEIKEA